MSQISVTKLYLPVVCSQKNADGTLAAFAVQVISGNISAPVSTVACSAINSSGLVSCAGLNSSAVINANNGLIGSSVTCLGNLTMNSNPVGDTPVTLAYSAGGLVVSYTGESEAFVPSNMAGLCTGFNYSDENLGETDFIGCGQGWQGGINLYSQTAMVAPVLLASFMPTLTTLTHGLEFSSLAAIPAAADDAAAQAAGVAVGGVYRTNANPSVLCIRAA